MPSKDANSIIDIILDASIKVHNELGPRLFESVYEEVLMYELVKRSLSVQKQKAIPVIYDGIKFVNGFRSDLFVEGMVMIEIKSIGMLAPVHFKQIHTYLKLSGVRNGVLVNLTLTC